MGGLLSSEPAPPVYIVRSSNSTCHHNSYNYPTNSTVPGGFTRASTSANNFRPSTSSRSSVERKDYLIRSSSARYVQPAVNRSNTFTTEQKHVFNSVVNRCQRELLWQEIPSRNEVTLITLPHGSAEYTSIQALFVKFLRLSTPVVHKIQKIQNPYLMGQYYLKKEEFKAKNLVVEEKLLFHGTKHINVDNICKNNFDWRKTKAHKFGNGVSFSPKSSYALHYCDKYSKVMFLAKVLVSKTCCGNENMNLPPCFRGTTRYDTSIKPNLDVYVKYYDDEFYPAYIIHFSANVVKVKKNQPII